jgi:hypothetical protein
MKLDEPDDPVAICLFCPIGVMMVAQDLANLFHQLQFRIRLEFGLVFHAIEY